MKLYNRSPFPIFVMRNAETDYSTGVLCVCASTHRIEPGLPPAEAQRPIVSSDPRLPGDAHWTKRGVSVCAEGFVYPSEPHGREGAARLSVGDRAATVLAFGRRVWARGALGLTPTRPLPFDRVPMRWERAFGGKALRPSRMVKVNGVDVLCPRVLDVAPDNPDGVGFYVTAEQAVDQPLPDLEHDGQRIAAWDDRPEPSCFAPYPLNGALRLRLLDVDVTKIELPEWGFVDIRSFDGRIPRLEDMPLRPEHAERLPSRAAPRTTFDAVPPGTPVALSGMCPGGAVLAFTMPPCPVVVATVIGDTETRLVPVLDAIDVDAEAREVRLLWRTKLAYDLVQFETRELSVEPSTG
jgi:hypothetical protein